MALAWIGIATAGLDLLSDALQAESIIGFASKAITGVVTKAADAFGLSGAVKVAGEVVDAGAKLIDSGLKAKSAVEGAVGEVKQAVGGVKHALDKTYERTANLYKTGENLAVNGISVFPDNFFEYDTSAIKISLPSGISVPQRLSNDGIAVKQLLTSHSQSVESKKRNPYHTGSEHEMNDVTLHPFKKYKTDSSAFPDQTPLTDGVSRIFNV